MAVFHRSFGGDGGSCTLVQLAWNNLLFQTRNIAKLSVIKNQVKVANLIIYQNQKSDQMAILSHKIKYL